MKELTVGGNEAGQRLDKFLRKYFDRAPRGVLYKMLRKKNIVLNGKKAGGNEILLSGDKIGLFLAEETIKKFSEKVFENVSGRISVVYEDEHILLINKPLGMLSQKADKEEPSLVEYLRAYLLDSGQLTREDMRAFKPSVCNRLDRNTSGLIAAGKSLAGLQELSGLFKDRSLKKEYLCLAAGRPKEDACAKGWLFKDEAANKVLASDKARPLSRPAETRYKAVKYGKDAALLKVHLITGRTHQIRAQLSFAGYPIIGDTKYGKREVNKIYREAYGLTGQLLHAYKLGFPKLTGTLGHLSGREFTAPLPKIFEKIIKEVCYNGDMEYEGP